MTCNTFTITSDSYTITLNKPAPSGEDTTISKDVRLFDFWSGNFDTDDAGIIDRPLHLTGVEYLAGDNIGICFPICFPICFNKPLSQKFAHIWEIQEAHEKVTISNLGDCIDGVYIIKNFTFKTIVGSPTAYSWSMDIELVRRL
jgi:hypothetical protein